MELVAVYGTVVRCEEERSPTAMALLFEFPYENEDVE